LQALAKLIPRRFPTLENLGFAPAGIEFPPLAIDRAKIKNYARTRDSMGEEGTTRLGLHLRFGTISVRKLVKTAAELSQAFLSELIWREFFQQILYHFPHTESEPFDPRFAKIKWVGTEKQFEAWKAGRTGYPLVDAAMHQINATGFMHNRARMVAASFLAKHLLINWRKGERYVAEKLLDYDLASNVGNWQWAAGCGCDAAPYFRVFNPALQAKRFDKQGRYVSKWDGDSGVKPIVNHERARKRALAAYNKALG
jgi:deoxyribodipyrimidine photo-lyase